jgi:hypothetical protein
MYSIEKPYIVYSLPSSKVHQPLISRKLPSAWAEIQNFLTNVTSASFVKPDSIQIQIRTFRNSSDLDEPLSLGVPELREDPELIDFLTNGTPQQRPGVWELESENLNSVIQYFSRIQPTLKNNYDIELYLSYSFKLINPLTHEFLESQELISHISVYFSRTHICLPTLFFPYQEGNEYFWRYIDSIKQLLPFVLEEKYLKLARLKNGRPTSFKKINR